MRSLLRCARCTFVTGDAARSRADKVPRCPPCERRNDHERRLENGDAWYRRCIADHARTTYGPFWEEKPGFDYCAEFFADCRALGGWAAVGVEMAPPRPHVEILTRPCGSCGGPTTSLTNYMCAACHFAGWWGHYTNEHAADTAAGRSTT